ncbi:hypothetical protein [Agromyces mangrovi Wang et al. 2018]|uniref:hypothetical protein n=1 Tax=Agromyces mangrovi TaxID=1858653 RepID=UPI002572CD7D|nr:hypothetical protein [Agromyces mangrovi]BDZ64652.1 hypothetical protein GCM10025877_15900 [Agromyces mangrovi]
MRNLPSGDETLSRRTVTRAMAWSVPAIAVAATVPAMAASPSLITVSGLGCTLPGNANATYRGHAFLLSLVNVSNVPVVVNVTQATLNGENLGPVRAVNLATCVGSNNPFGLAANTTYPRVALLTQNAVSNPSATLALTYTIDGGVSFETTLATVNATSPVQSSAAFSASEKQCMLTQGTTTPWQAGTAYAVNNVVTIGGAWLSANNSGTSSGTQPVAPGAGNTVVDNDITWTQLF